MSFSTAFEGPLRTLKAADSRLRLQTKKTESANQDMSQFWLCTPRLDGTGFAAMARTRPKRRKRSGARQITERIDCWLVADSRAVSSSN